MSSGHGPPAQRHVRHGPLHDPPYEGLASITTFPPSVDPNLQFLAAHYALAEANFQPEIAPTLPNVLAALAGTSDGWYSNNDPPARTGSTRSSTSYRRPGGSWEIFYGVPPSGWPGRLGPADAGGAYRQLVGTDQFIAEAAAGTLPDFSFVRPGLRLQRGVPRGHIARAMPGWASWSWP